MTKIDLLPLIFHSEKRMPECYLFTCEKAQTFTREHYLKDHLGNPHITFAADAETVTLVQSVNYYPFGLTFGEYNNTSTTTQNLFLYNGKELQNDPENSLENLDLLDYGARFYDMIVPHFGQVDPKAEQFPWQSPYCYAANNPIRFIDKNGENPVLGFFLGGLTEYATQVTVNLIKGDSFTDAAWNNVDMADVGLSAVEGAATSGVSVVRKIGMSVLAEGVKAAVDFKGSGKTDIVGTVGSTKNTNSIITDVAVGTGTGVVSSVGADKLLKASSADALKSASSNLTAKTKNLNKANQVMSTGDSRSKAALPSNAYSEFANAKSNLSTTKALNSTVGKVNNNVVNETAGYSGGVVGEGVKTLKEDIVK